MTVYVTPRKVNWLALVPRIKTAKGEMLADTLERIVRIYDTYDGDYAQFNYENFYDDVRDVLDELRRDL